MALSDAVPYAVAHWALDEASGTRVDTVNGYNLSDYNTVLSGTGVFSNSADFESSNSEYLRDSTNRSDLDGGDVDLCFAVWVKLESKTANGAIFSVWTDNGATRGFNLIYDSSTDRFVATFRKGTTAVYTTVSADNLGAPSTDTWYLIHLWHDSVANEIGISVNAGTADIISESDGINVSGVVPFTVGAKQKGGPPGASFEWYFDGLIDDLVVLRGYILDSTERSAHYNSGTGVAFEDWSAGGGSYSLTANQGSYSLSGQTSSLLAARMTSLAQGSYSGSGQSVGAFKGSSLPSAHASYGLSGQNATLRPDYHIQPQQASYAKSGQDVILEKTGEFALVADLGSYNKTGQISLLKTGRNLSALHDTYTLSGRDADLVLSHILLLLQGSYGLGGQEVTFPTLTILPPSSGLYQLVGRKTGWSIT